MRQLPKLLLIEDDPSIAGALAHTLRGDYDVDIAANGKLGLYKTDTNDYAAVILDLNLPDIPGLFICQQLRERGVNAPILVLSGETRVLTKINLLDSGADDYLTKPFSLGELKARLRALARHQPLIISKSPTLTVGDLLLDRINHRVTRSGFEVRLRRKEFALLECLMEHAGAIVSRDTLLQIVWNGSAEMWTNTLEVHIKNLRDKIDRPFGQPMIFTAHGLGYKLESLQPAFSLGE